MHTYTYMYTHIYIHICIHTYAAFSLISFYSIVDSKSDGLLISVSTNEILVKDGALIFIYI